KFAAYGYICVAPDMASHWKGHLIRCRAQISRNLERHRKNYEFKVFAEMPHGWLNDTMPGRYRQAATEAAWAMMIDFLHRVYAGAYPPGRARSRFDSDISVDYDFKNNVRLE